jgi:hypothetical protein
MRLFFKFGHMSTFPDLLMARSLKNPVGTYTTPDSGRQFQGDTLREWHQTLNVGALSTI